MCLCARARAHHFTRGDYRRCTELADEGMEFADRIGDRGMVMEASKWVGQTMLYRADFAGARDRLAMAVDQYYCPEDKQKEAIPLIRRGIHAWRATGAELILPVQLSALGDAYTQAGRFEDARQALDEGLAIAERNDEQFHEAELHRLKGELLLAESPDQAVAAEERFRRAIEIAQHQRSRAWELRARMSLARLWQRQSGRGEARAALAAVFDTYTEGFTTPDLVEARSLLEALG